MPRKKKTESAPASVWGKILTGDANEYLPLFEFAQQLKLKEEYLIGLAKSGRLKAFKIDDYWLSTAAWVKEWLEEVKGHLHQEIAAVSPQPIAPATEVKEEAALISPKPAAIRPPKTKKVSPVVDLITAKEELLAEIAKAEETIPEQGWVKYLANHNSLWELLNSPLRLSPVPQRASVNSYALILAVALIFTAGLFLYTTALASF